MSSDSNENNEHVEASPPEDPTASLPIESQPGANTQTSGPSWLTSAFAYRLHPTSLAFDIIAHSRAYLIPAVIALFSAAQGSMTGIIFAGVLFFPAVLTSIFRYFTLRYTIQNGELIVVEGLFFRRTRTVPISRIQNVDLVQNVLHRLFGVAEVRVETASGTEAEATLRVLSMDRIEQLRNDIFSLRNTKAAGIATPEQTDGETTEPFALPLNDLPTTEVLNISSKWLVLAGLASNRGIILLGILIGLYYQFDLNKYFDLEKIAEAVPQQFDTAFIVTAGIVIFVLLMILLRLVGILWYMLRFHGYKMTRAGEDLRISCGLLTKVSATVPRHRVQFISVHRSLIMRWMRLASIRIETAGGSGNESENAAATVSGRWFIPVVPDAMVPELINELRPGIVWTEDDFDWQPLAVDARKRLLRIYIIVCILILVIGAIASRSWWWAFAGLILPYAIMMAIRRSRSMRYARTGFGVVFRSGIFYRRTSATFFEKIQTLRVDQSPFDRRWHMATLSVDTAAAGPADHRIQIPLLDADFALKEYNAIRQLSAGREPSFG